MAENGQELEPRRARLVALLADGATTAEAAAQLGVSERMARRWRATPEVKAALDEIGREALRSASSSLARLVALAASALREIVADRQAPPAARVSAARAIVESSIRLREMGELEERLETLEARMETSHAL